MPRNLPFAPQALSAFLVIAAAILSGCATESAKTPTAPRPTVHLTDDTETALLPPSDIAAPLDEIQRVEARFDGREYAMNALVAADARGITMVGLGDLGQELFALEYREDRLSLDGPAAAAGIDPAYVVIDLQLAFYRGKALRRTLEDSGLALEEAVDGDAVSRTVLRNGRVIIEIRIAPDSVRLENRLRGYAYIITRNRDA